MYLNENELDSLKMILNQSHVGLHLLFDNQFITEVFKENFNEDDFFNVDNLISAQVELIKLIKIKTIFEKKNFIANLNLQSRKRLVRTYFYIIENDIRQNQKQPH